MVFLSTLLSFISLGFLIFASLVKGKRMGLILAFVCIGNVLQGIGYIFAGDAEGGVIACFYGALIAFVNSFFDKKERSVPLWLLAVYAVVFVAINLLTSGVGDYSAFIVIAAFLAYVLGTASKSGKMYRIWSISNSTLWCVYDIVTASYGVLPTHIILLSVSLIGMIIHDRKK